MPATSSEFKRSLRQRRSHLYSRGGNRLRELDRIIGDRHGKVPDTDDNDIYLHPIARCYRKILLDKGKSASVRDVADRLGVWCGRLAPHLSPEQVTDIACCALDELPHFDHDDVLGASLRLSYADRQRLKIRTIGSCDVDKKSRTKLNRARKRERDRLRAADNRRAKGALPRAIYEAQSLSRAKPWEQLGISRATFMRHRKKAIEASKPLETSASPHPSYIHMRRTCLNSTALKDSGEVELSALARVGQQAKNLIGLTSGVPSDDQSLAWQPDGPDGPIPAHAFLDEEPISRKLSKTRIRSTFCPTGRQRRIAAEEGISPERIQNLFEAFTCFHLAQRTYSTDWTVSWRNWLIRQIEIDDKLEAMNRAWRAA